MAKKQYYAVRIGRRTGIFPSWDMCKKQIEGYSGAEYKGFSTLKEAEDYVDFKEELQNNQLANKPSHITAYVDGSYDAEKKVYGYGCVMILPDGNIVKMNGAGNNKKSAELRNVTGEMLAAMIAVRYAIENGYKTIQICYDYVGVENWATAKWKTKTELTKKYAFSMQKWSKEITILYKKVAAHTNVEYNEMADGLAKDAINFFKK